MPTRLEIQSSQPDVQVRQGRKRQARQARREFNAALADVDTQWANLNANQQREAMRRLLLVLARLADGS
jgi:hypothetical protein